MVDVPAGKTTCTCLSTGFELVSVRERRASADERFSYYCDTHYPDGAVQLFEPPVHQPAEGDRGHADGSGAVVGADRFGKDGGGLPTGRHQIAGAHSFRSSAHAGHVELPTVRRRAGN